MAHSKMPTTSRTRREKRTLKAIRRQSSLAIRKTSRRFLITAGERDSRKDVRGRLRFVRRHTGG